MAVAALASDAVVLAALGSATFFETFVDVLPIEAAANHAVANNTTKLFEQALQDDHIWWGSVEADGPAVGYAWLRFDGTDWELKRLYVLSRFQGQGVGCALMTAALEGARHFGAQRVVLGVYQHNHAAVQFYRARGFAVVGQREFMVGGHLCQDHIMAKEL